MTFTAVKTRRNILFKLILILLCFLYSGIDAYTDSDFAIYHESIEIITDTNNSENNFSTDPDPNHDDQIYNSQISAITEPTECQYYYQWHLPSVNKLYLPVWQPPKIS